MWIHRDIAQWFEEASEYGVNIKRELDEKEIAIVDASLLLQKEQIWIKKVKHRVLVKSTPL